MCWPYSVIALVFFLFLRFYIFLLYLFVGVQYIEVVHRRKQQDGVQSRSVMVRQIPSTIKSDNDLLNFFRSYYGTAVIHAELCPHLPRLVAAIKKRKTLLEEYNAAKEMMEKTGKLQKHLVFTGTYPRVYGGVCVCGVCVCVCVYISWGCLCV